MTGTGRGRSMGTWRSSMMSSVRTATDRSIAMSRRHQSRHTTGVTAPTVSKAPRVPSKEISSGATIYPMPTANAPTLSRTPNTRARTTLGTIRAMSVNAVTSTSALPT